MTVKKLLPPGTMAVCSVDIDQLILWSSYNCDLDNEFEIEDNRNQMDFEEEEEDDNQIDIEEEDDDEVELDPRELIMEFDEAEFEQGMYINYDDNVYVGSYKYF